jgi:thiamine-monophosphate kinase
MLNESAVIEKIWKVLPTRARRKGSDWLRLGVGDDAAVIRASSQRFGDGGDWVLSTDAFLEGVHFLPGVHSPVDIGYKALARATSDLVAMGATPRFFLLSLALPADRTGTWLDGFLKGMALAAREFGMAVVGGDTSRFCSVVINVTVGGRASRGNVMVGRSSPPQGRASHILTRSGSTPGDLIYASGTLGAAQLGLELILHGLDGKASTPRLPRGRQWRPILQPHLRPKIHIVLGRWLAGLNPSSRKVASAAIDTSDGLSKDLSHICEASGVGARLWAEKIPAVRIPQALQRGNAKLDPLDFALHGGEDYQLLFTVPPQAARRLPRRFHGIPLTQIGEILRLPARKSQRASRIELVTAGERVVPLKLKGWNSFAARSSK